MRLITRACEGYHAFDGAYVKASKNQGPFLGVPTMRIIAYWNLY